MRFERIVSKDKKRANSALCKFFVFNITILGSEKNAGIFVLGEAQ